MRFLLIGLAIAIAFVSRQVQAKGEKMFEPPRKHIIAHGWDLLAMSPDEVLAHADHFDRTGLDGVTLMINEKLPDGRKISHARIMNDPPWPRKALRDKIATLREIAKHPSLRESFLSAWWSPKKRLSWSDDEAWTIVASNMATLAWLAREGGLRGIVVDTEDYVGSRQYFIGKDDPPYAEAASLARRRGAQVFSAVFREYPDITVLSFWMLSLKAEYFRGDDPLSLARDGGDLWPWFVNGMLDVIPPQARFVDGNEHGYGYKAERNDFYRSASEQFTAALALVAPENRGRYRAQLMTGFGLYMDSYVVPKTNQYYRADADGSRLDCLARHLQQAVRASDGYVWLYGEKCSWVPWRNTRDVSFATAKTWEDCLPGLSGRLAEVKDARTALSRRVERLFATGGLVNALSDVKEWGRWQDPKLHQGRMEPDGNGVALAGCGCACHIAYVTNVVCGEKYAVRLKKKGDGYASVFWQRNGEFLWKIKCTPVAFDNPDANGWRTGVALVTVPKGTDRLAMQLGASQSESDRVVFHDIAVVRVDDSSMLE